jgi:putative methionine-R-sulfoxide reductase with GAF domain
MERTRRDYDAIARGLTSVGTSAVRMTMVADRLWEHRDTLALSWVGFYLDHPGEPDDRRLVLGPHRDRPACSPIGMHGVCGQAIAARRARIVEDVETLGDAYVACDPNDRAELVVPLIDELGVAWGVLDLDSTQVAAFDESDAAGLERVLRTAGLLP